MKKLAATVCVLAAFATAADARCYRREYSPAHLIKHPNQTVRMIQFRIGNGETPKATAKVRFRDDDKLWSTPLLCDMNAEHGLKEGQLKCAVECDGGSVIVSGRHSKVLYLATGRGFAVGPDCDESVIRWVRDEGAEKTVFKLWAPKQSACE